MKTIAVLSDTHGLLRPEVLEHVIGCDAILHAGDIDTPAILETLREYAPVYAVCGNADVSWAEVEGVPQSARPDLFGLRFFLIHNKSQLREDLTDRAIIITGHTHKYKEKTENGQFWLNPGSCGPRSATMPITMARIETEEDGTFRVTRIDIPHPDAG